MTIQKTSIQARMPSNEVLALDYLRKLDKHRRGRMAAHIHISNLQPQNRREHHIRIAANSFDGLTKRMLGQLFVMTNADLMFLFKEEAREEVEAALVKLRFLFSDDPLMADDAGGITTFATWYNLGKDYERLVGAISRMDDDEHHRRKSEAARSAAGTQPQAAAPTGEPLTPQLLARVEDALSRADVSNLVRRQSVCGIVGGSTPQPVFQELFISIPDLRQTLLPKVNLASSPWLFQHLTETLDRRVLALLNKHDDNTLAGDISINLNVATLLSPDFLAFDDNLKQGMRGTIVIELQKTDIYADLGAFLFARDFAHEHGYRICVDGLNHLTLPFIDRERLGVDLLKVVWDPEMTRGRLRDGRTVGDLIEHIGPQRIILCRCDNQDAVDFGHSIGITMFQGRHVETLLAAESARRRGPVVNRRK